jgi:hypothetical protein
MFPSPQPWFVALWLLSPVLALVALLGFLSVLPKGADASGNVLVLVGMLTPFAGGIPILRWKGQAKGFKAFVFLIYYLVCAAAMFIAGWAAIGILGLAK